MKKIAIPVDETGRLDAHFGHCRYFMVFMEENGQIIAQDRITPPPHEPGVLPKWLSEKGVTDVITGGMGQMALKLFHQRGVNAFVGAPQISSFDLIQEFVDNKLDLTGNHCDHEHEEGCTGH